VSRPRLPARLVTVALSLLVLLAGLPGAVTAAGSAPGPRLRAPERQLDPAVTCHGRIGPGTRTPVLLVHGTGVTSEENWRTYVPWLLGTGRGVCTVELVRRGTVDLQRSVERVVHGVRTVAARHRGRIDVVGHSQGGTQLVYAIKFWPDLARLVDDYVGLAPLVNKSLFGDLRCQTPCGEPIQQTRSGSRWMRSFLTHPLPAGPSYTTIASRYDEVVVPAPESSHLAGARNIVLQDVCGPQKYVDHYLFAVDGTTSDIVLDALDHPGPADPARLPADSCQRAYPRGVSPLLVAETGAGAGLGMVEHSGDDGPNVTEEPPLRCYMRRSCADVDDRGRLLRTVRCTRDGLRLDVQASGRLRVVARHGRRLVVRQSLLRPGVRRLRLSLPDDGRWTVRALTRTGWYVRYAAERRVACTRP
jgi:triacylglycerol lipase